MFYSIKIPSYSVELIDATINSEIENGSELFSIVAIKDGDKILATFKK